MTDHKTTAARHDVRLEIQPPIPQGKALVIVVRDGEMFHRVVAKDDAALLDPLFSEAMKDGR